MTCPTCRREIPDDGLCPHCQDAPTGVVLPPDAPTGAVTPDDDATRLGMPSPTGPGAAGVVPTQMEAGDSFGTRYRILKKLGVGGMGVVYQAWDQTLNVVVALKVIRPDVVNDPAGAADIERRFKRELLLARQVTHKNVVRIHDLGDVDGTKYITMSFVEGDDLSTILRRDGALPLATVLPIAREVAAGLCAAHEAGVVHRDLKPANIMVDKDGHALIMDFGIAVAGGAESRVQSPGSRVQGPESRVQGPGSAGPDGDATVMAAPAATGVSGVIIGTLEYMSPEQSKGEPVDHRTDIYAFGLILTDLLLGPRTREPGQTPWEALTDRISKPPVPMATRSTNVTEAVDAVVLQCLQLSPDQRFLATADLVKALDRIDDEGNLIPEAKRWTPKTIAAAAVLVSGLVAGTWWFSKGPVVQPTEPVSILIADFANRTNDPVFTGLVEQAMAVGVESASFVTVYPRPSALRLAATLQPGARLEPAVAKLVSMREGLDVIVGGEVLTDGSGVAIRVTATRAETDEVLLDWTTGSAPKDQVLDAVGLAAARVRETLGDTKTDSAASDAETFTAATLEAAKAYSEAQEFGWAGKPEEATAAYQRALAIDPGFGRAHAGLAATYANLRRPAEAEASYLAALSHLDRMTEREKFRTRGGYYLFKRNSDKALEEFEALVAQFPADSAGLANLAFAQFQRRELAKALETGVRASDIYPTNVIRRNNAALFAMYAGQFDQAIALANDALKITPERVKAYVAIALSQLALGQASESSATWDRLAAVGTTDAKADAASGRIDLALFQGRDAEALKLIDAAIAEDRAARNLVSAGRRLAIKGEVLLARGNKPAALKAAREAAAAGREFGILYLAGRTMIAAGQPKEALALATDLDNRLENEPRIYGALLQGEASLAAGRPRDAMDYFEIAQKLADTWLGRLSLGRAYLALGAFPEAASEFDRCLARKGEATAVFMDDLPSYRLMRPIEDLLTKAKSGLR
jgi:serine/threonine protein kinase/tetratricopeptide (TPR) repeat protein